MGLLGNVITSTDYPKSFKASLTQDNNLVSPICFRINLDDNVEEYPSSYEAGTMKYVEVNLYNGDETAVTHEPPVATYTITGTDVDPLKEKLYGTNSMLLTATDFNISTSTITSSKYTVEISSARDYTRYGNTFIVQNNIQTFNKQATLPDLTSIDVNNGLTVTPITLANISQYVDSTEVAAYQKYDSDIVFGYEVCASYFDNSAQLIDVFDYYAFEDTDYAAATTPAPTSSANFYARNVQKAVISKTVLESGAVPSAVFLFGKDEAVNMTRGSKYVFTYRAKMKKADSSGVNYFPDTQSTSAIIRSKTMSAPYQKPRFYFYPWISSDSSVTWKYYIEAPDTSAVIGNFKVSVGTITSGAVPKLNIVDNVSNAVEVIVGDLSRGNIYSMQIVTSQYKAIYGKNVTNTLVGQYFEGDYTFQKATTSLSYQMEDVSAQNRYRITVNDSDDDISSLSRVVALKVSVYKAGATSGAALKTITVPFDYITMKSSGGSGVGFLRYSDIKDLIGNTLDFKITAVYDSGISGFKDMVNATCAVQLLPANGKGNYMMLNSTSTALVENSTGNAMGSYYQIFSMSKATSLISFSYNSLIDDSFVGGLSFGNNDNGAKLLNLNGQPYATLKATREVDLHITDNNAVDLTEFTFDSMTPTVNLNRGAAYTIDTTVNSATVHWTLTGQDEKLDEGEIKDSKMYFNLYKITALGAKEDLKITIPTGIQKGVTRYDTIINDLIPDTKYGIDIYYIDSSTGKKVYPINAYLPEKEPSSNMYTFTTSSTIAITPSMTPVKYVANSYLDKYLQISYTLNQTLGFDINYSICQKQGTEYKVLLTSDELSNRGIIKTPLVNKEDMLDERIILSPGKVYWKDALNNTVYFPFNNTDYYLCIKPVSETNSSIELGTPVYIQLNITPLNTPFYKVKTVPSLNAVTFQVSVLDIGKVMVNGCYKVKVLNGTGKDITPEDNKNIVYYISNPLSIKVSGIADADKAIIHLYAVHDMQNTGKAADDSMLQDISQVNYDDLDTIGKNYLKVSYTGYPLSGSGYDLGDVQIQQCSSEHARIYFTDSVNLGIIKHIRYVVVNEAGVSYNYYEPFSVAELNSNGSYYELSHQFTSTGVYQIQIRFYDESKTQLDDLALTYYKNY